MRVGVTPLLSLLVMMMMMMMTISVCCVKVNDHDDHDDDDDDDDETCCDEEEGGDERKRRSNEDEQGKLEYYVRKTSNNSRNDSLDIDANIPGLGNGTTVMEKRVWLVVGGCVGVIITIAGLLLFSVCLCKLFCRRRCHTADSSVHTSLMTGTDEGVLLTDSYGGGGRSLEDGDEMFGGLREGDGSEEQNEDHSEDSITSSQLSMLAEVGSDFSSLESSVSLGKDNNSFSGLAVTHESHVPTDLPLISLPRSRPSPEGQSSSSSPSPPLSSSPLITN